MKNRGLAGDRVRVTGGGGGKSADRDSSCGFLPGPQPLGGRGWPRRAGAGGAWAARRPQAGRLRSPAEEGGAHAIDYLKIHLSTLIHN